MVAPRPTVFNRPCRLASSAARTCTGSARITSGHGPNSTTVAVDGPSKRVSSNAENGGMPAAATRTEKKAPNRRSGPRAEASSGRGKCSGDVARVLDGARGGLVVPHDHRASSAGAKRCGRLLFYRTI